MNFVAEKENKYVMYYILKPKKGMGCLVEAFSGQQAIAKAVKYFGKFNSIVCVKVL